MAYRIWDMPYGIWHIGYAIWDMPYGIWDMRGGESRVGLEGPKISRIFTRFGHLVRLVTPVSMPNA
mgnify:CR=1 FL=1